MLKRWKKWIRHSWPRQLVLSYILIGATLLLSYFVGLRFGPNAGWITLGAGSIFVLAWLAWLDYLL